MGKYEEIFENRVFTNDEIKKLQEEKNNNSKKKQHFINYKLYDITKRQKIKIKESDYKNIRKKLNDIFKKYYEKLSKRKITSIEEFYDMIMISFVLYDQIENINFTENNENNNKLLEFKDKLKKYNELKEQKSIYSKNNQKYKDGIELKEYDLELENIDIQIDQIRKEIMQFTKVFLSELWSDYEKFKKFIEEEENVKTLAQLTDLNRTFEELEEINLFENYSNIRNKLEHYFLDIEEFDFPINEKKDVRSSVENILKSFDKENDVINVMLHFSYANILIRSNIMKFPIISEEHKENSSLINEIRALKYDMINYYRDTLTYRDSIEINDEILENQSDALFYDILYLQNNRDNSVKRNFRTFDNLYSSKENQKIYLKNGTSEIDINGENVLIRCSIEDFIQISNSLEMIEKLKEENEQKNFLSFLDKDDEYYKDKKFKLKSKFVSERDNIINRIETVTEIEEELIKKGMRLIPIERRFLFSLLEKSSNETENFKLVMKKILKNPYFMKKIIKFESIGKNDSYDELYKDISYIEKISDTLMDYDIVNLSDAEDSLRNLDNLYNFNFEVLGDDVIDKEILEELKEYQKNYRKITGGENHAEEAL